MNEEKTNKIKAWFDASNGNTNLMVLVSWIVVFVAGLALGRLL
jgi:hypothetical protein